MREEKSRNGLITVRYSVQEHQGKLTKIGWFRLGTNEEVLIFRTKPEDQEVYPFYLEIRSHRVFKHFIGKEVEIQGFLTINHITGKIRSAHLTPCNLPLLDLCMDLLIYEKGKADVVQELIKHIDSQVVK
jgi:hypothetical protein